MTEKIRILAELLRCSLLMNDICFHISPKAFNEAYIPTLYDTRRYLIFYGGAGSGKSYFIAQRYIVKILESKMCNILVVRAYANTNKISTYALFRQVIEKWNLGKYFKCYDGEVKIRCLLNENTIIFKGLDDSEKLKSVTFPKGELTDIWVEEASEIASESDFNQLDVRLRGIGVKKQITVSFNPVDVNHWLKKRFFDRKSKEVYICHTTYKDNRFLDKDYVNLLESYKTTDPYYYSVYCMGVWGVYGKTVFCAEKIQKRLTELKSPIKTGYFTFSDDGLKISDIEFVEDENGFIKIYEEPIWGTPYVIGGDTAGEGSDRFVAQVLNNVTGNQAAVLWDNLDEDIYARQMYCLGMYYNEALIGIEANFSTYPIKELIRLKYKKQYVREKEDSITGSYSKSYGFKTTAITRPVIIANLVKITRENIELINDPDTLMELLTFVRNKNGRAEAKAGSHDDLVMALAISYRIREQQTDKVKEEIKAIKFDFFNETPKKEREIGEEVRLI